MAAKGTIAKDLVEAKIKAAFGEDFVGVVDKKIYVAAMENGEMVQVAISLTCPKVPISLDKTVQVNGFNFEDPTQDTKASAIFTPAQITPDEKANIEALMARLGL